MKFTKSSKESEKKMTNIKMTRAQAIANAIAKFDVNAPEIEVLEKMLAQVTRKPEKKAGPTKTQLLNGQLLVKCVEAIKAHPEDTITARWLVDHIKDVNTTQKASSLMERGIKEGTIRKEYNKKVANYFIVE